MPTFDKITPTIIKPILTNERFNLQRQLKDIAISHENYDTIAQFISWFKRVSTESDMRYYIAIPFDSFQEKISKTNAPFVLAFLDKKLVKTEDSFFDIDAYDGNAILEKLKLEEYGFSHVISKSEEIDHVFMEITADDCKKIVDQLYGD